MRFYLPQDVINLEPTKVFEQFYKIILTLSVSAKNAFLYSLVLRNLLF